MNSLIRYTGSLSRKLILWNVLALIFVKFIFSPSAFQLATLLDSIPLFDSREVVSLTNKTRTENNLSPLSSNFKLDLAAQQKLSDMASKGYFAHISPDGTTPWAWIKDSQYNYIYAGENLAIGFMSAGEAVTAWMNSPSHKENILNPNYRDIGVAVGRASMDGAEGILVVQMFGSEKTLAVAPRTTASPAPAPSPNPSVLPATTQNVIPPAKLAVAVKKEPSVRFERVSTIENIPPTQAQAVKFENGEEIKDVRNWVNLGHLAFAVALALASVLALIFIERSRAMMFRTALNIAVLVLALWLPQLGTTLEGLIF